MFWYYLCCQKKSERRKSFLDFRRSFWRSDFWRSDLSTLWSSFKILSTFWPFDVLIFDVPIPSPSRTPQKKFYSKGLLFIVFLNFAYPLWASHVPLGVRVPQVENRCTNALKMYSKSQITFIKVYIIMITIDMWEGIYTHIFLKRFCFSV